MQSSSAYLDPDNTDTTSYESDNGRWSNIRPISVPSSPSTVASISHHSLDSTLALSQTNLLAETGTNNPPSAFPLLFPSPNTTSVPIHTPLPTYPLPSSTIQPIQQLNLPNMNIPPQNVQVPPLYNMPIRGSKLAPKTFKGNYHKVTGFIRHYTRLLDQHRVVLEAEKCQGILEYCSQKVKDFVKSSIHYQAGDWQQLQAEILKYYDAEREESRYRVADLTAFVQQSSHEIISDLAQWKKYYREYFAIAGFLKQKGYIDNKIYTGYFWYGIAPHLQKAFEEKLYINYPHFDASNPWPIEYLDEVANIYFKRNKFPQRLGYLPVTEHYAQKDYETEEDSDYDSDDESDDEDYAYRKKRTLKKKKAKAKKAPITQVMSDDPMRKVPSPPEEVENLIQQLNTMSLDDPKYGQLYYKAAMSDTTGLAVQCIRRAPMTEKSPGIIQRGLPPPPRGLAPSFPNSLPTRSPTSYPQQPRSNKCYGCFETTHIMADCPMLAKLVAKGAIQYNQQTRKYCQPNGQPIYRRTEESLVESLERLNGATSKQSKVNFVTLTSGVTNFWAKRDENEDSNLCWPDTDSEDDGPYWRYAQPAAVRGEYPTYSAIDDGPSAGDESDDEENFYEAYPVERTNKRTTEARKEVTRGPAKARFDAPNVPERLKTRSSGPAPEIPKDTPRQRYNNKPPVKPSEVPIVLEPIPVEARQPRLSALENLPESSRGNQPNISEKKTRAEVRAPEKAPEKMQIDKSRSGPRQSELTTQVNLNTVLDEILDTPIPLSIRKILGTSKELSSGMFDRVKLKNQPKQVPPAEPAGRVLMNNSITGNTPTMRMLTKFEREAAENLIRLTFQCHGNPITAVIDTGSEINVVSSTIATERIPLPLDTQNTTTMGDANGGGYLKGLISTVPLTCRAVKT